VNPKDSLRLSFGRGDWIRLLILIPRVVSLSVFIVYWIRENQYVVLMAAPSLRGRCVDINLNGGSYVWGIPFH
jgi:hypothetical protein